MANANLTMGVNGVDKTGAAFSSVKNRARATGASIRAMFASAFAAAGAYMGARSLVSTVNELGRLSDIAQKTGTNVDELTKSATAFGVLGLKGMDPEGIAKAMAFMEKNTGRTGLPGFYDTIEEIAKLPDVAARSQAAVKAFGRSGLELTPFIEAGAEGVAAIKAVTDAMPGISQAAADAGDSAADSLSVAQAQIKSIWAEGIGFICRQMDDGFVGGAREAALTVGAWFEYAIKKAAAKVTRFMTEMGNTLAGIGLTVWEAAKGVFDDRSWSEVGQDISYIWRAVEEEGAEAERKEEERLARFKARYEERKRAISGFADNYAKAAALMNKQRRQQAAEDKNAGAKNAKEHAGFTVAGTNEAIRLAVYGPEMQSAQKKQTEILKLVEENTRKIANNTDGLESGEYGVID